MVVRMHKYDIDLNQLKKSFGSSNEFIKSIYKNYKSELPEDRKPSDALAKEIQLLASCTYDKDIDWGAKVVYRFFTVVEDAITAISLHCNGYISIFMDPDRPCFLGASPKNLNDMLVQQTRWSFGLMQIGLPKFSPLINGPLRMSILQSLGYSALVLDALYAVPFFGLGIIAPICLLYGIPLYPKRVRGRVFLIQILLLSLQSSSLSFIKGLPVIGNMLQLKQKNPTRLSPNDVIKERNHD